MSRWIELEPLIADLDKGLWGKDYDKALAEAIIQDAPSIDLADYVPKDFHDKTCEAMAKAHQEEIADMVSVVRCKECKWADWYKTADGKQFCYCMETGNGGRTADDFCSYGEREGER